MKVPSALDNSQKLSKLTNDASGNGLRLANRCAIEMESPLLGRSKSLTTGLNISRTSLVGRAYNAVSPTPTTMKACLTSLDPRKKLKIDSNIRLLKQEKLAEHEEFPGLVVLEMSREVLTTARTSLLCDICSAAASTRFSLSTGCSKCTTTQKWWFSRLDNSLRFSLPGSAIQYFTTDGY